MIVGGTRAINVMAGRARKEGIKNIERKFTLRNTFTRRQIQYTPMKEMKYVKITEIKASVGVTEKAPWMERQEKGGRHSPSMGQTLAIPTDRARGGHNRAVPGSMRVSRLKRRRIRKAKKKSYTSLIKSEKARKVARALVAFQTGLFVPIGDTMGRTNLFKVAEFHFQSAAKGKGYRERKKHRSVAFRLQQIYRFDRPSTVTSPEPWLLPASEKVHKQAQAIFNAQMDRVGK
jgi:hypothetical protein